MKLEDRIETIAAALDAASTGGVNGGDYGPSARSPVRRSRLAVACIVAVVAVAGAAVILASDDGSSVTVAADSGSDAPPDTSTSSASQGLEESSDRAGSPGWRLAARIDDGPLWATAAALQEEELGGALHLLGLDTTAAIDVHWESEILLLLASPVSSTCAEMTVLEFGFVVDSTTLAPVLGLGSGPTECTTDAIPAVFAVAVQRDALPPVFVVAPSARTPCSAPCSPHILTEIDLEAGTTRQFEG